MDIQANIAKIKELLSSAVNILVVTHAKPTFDSIGSSTSLMLGLKSLGKKVTLVCPDEMTVALSGFIGVNNITSEIPKKNFIVSLDYVDGSIEKVSYNIEGNKFNLVIEPRVGFDFSSEKVSYQNSGFNYDLVFVVDSPNLGLLGKIYEENKDLFTDKPVVNLDIHPENTLFGQINLVEKKACSMTEVIALVLSSNGAKLTQDIGTNILNSLYSQTNSFSTSNVTIRAFELATACMKAGGVRFNESNQTLIKDTVKPQQPVKVILEEVVNDDNKNTIPATFTTPVEKPSFEQPEKILNKKEEIEVIKSESSALNKNEGEIPKTPSDWLKPKIFKSSNI